MKALAATVLNISDDHLDRHKTFEHYSAIKQRIYQHCNSAIFSRDDKATLPAVIEKQMQVVSFGSDQAQQGQFGLSTHEGQCFLMHEEQALVALNTLPLQGMHNAMNYLAVLALGHAAGWSIPDMLASFLKFKGLAHRCELVDSTDGIRWINDSKATNVGATLAAIKGLSSTLNAEQKLILIAGGDGKNADFSPLKPALTKCVDHLITLGKDGDKIAQQRLASNTSTNYQVKTLSEAVSLARELAVAGDLVLLSPACASLDMFANYVERGIVFIKAIFDVKGGH
jgi:UDP-N-acetylmuramoylalanine--D-glutamate ligase